MSESRNMRCSAATEAGLPAKPEVPSPAVDHLGVAQCRGRHHPHVRFHQGWRSPPLFDLTE